MHHTLVPKDSNSPEVEDSMRNINECLAKLTIGDTAAQIPWKVMKAETVPHSNTNEMRWHIGPIKHNVNSREVAKRFHEIVVPTCFSNAVHYICVDLGQTAGVVKIVGSPTQAGISRELMECMSLENQTRLPAR